jgi:periplasmic protein TonB
MNIQRFKVPAIFAAGLHGALFLGFPESAVGIIPPPTEVVEIPIVPPREEPVLAVRPREEDDDPATVAGGGQPLPSRRDVLQPLTGKEIFTVPVEPYRPVINPAETLVDHRGLPTGPDVGPGRLRLPEIPDVGRLDRVPHAMVQPAPVYPDAMRRAGINGSVTVAFIVDTEGRVTKAEVMESTHREFEDAAVRAVMRWRFEPGTQSGSRVSFRMAVPIHFSTEQ